MATKIELVKVKKHPRVEMLEKKKELEKEKKKKTVKKCLRFLNGF